MRSLNYHIKLRQVNSIKIFSTPIAPRPSVPRLELYPGELFRLWNVHTHIGKSHRSKLSVAKVRSLPGRCWKKVGKAQPNQAAFVSQLHTSPDSPFPLGSSIGEYRVLVQTEGHFNRDSRVRCGA